MKRVFTILSVAASLMFAAGCSKSCYECTLASATQELCEGDYDSSDAFDTALAALDLLGYTCTQK
jgi:hypothetical protein